MFRVRIDGVEETVAFQKERGGWYYYHIFRNGKPVSEVSVPVLLDQPFTPFRTSGSKFERIQ